MTNTSIRSWKRINSRIVYSNPWVTVQEDQVQLPNGNTTIYGIMAPKTDFVGIVPLIDINTVILVRQYRYIQDEVTWEIPSGALNEQETPENAAQRELQEEIGYFAEKLQLVSVMHSNKSLMRDKGYIFIAEGLSPSSAKADETEVFECVTLPLSEALHMIHQYEITDCVSIIGLLMADKKRPISTQI